MVAVRSPETHQCTVELVPFPRPCCYKHNSKVNQHIGVENNKAEEAGNNKTVLTLIVKEK